MKWRNRSEVFQVVNRQMLDDSDAAKEQMEVVKSKLQQICNAESDEASAALGLLPPGFILPTDLVDPSTAVTEVRAEDRC